MCVLVVALLSHSKRVYYILVKSSYFFVPGVDLFSTISMFLGAIAFSVCVVALIYCIRYKESFF